MIPLRFSMRFTLGMTIVLMGMLGLALALTTSEYYRKEALGNQRSALADLAELAVNELLRDLEERARDMGLALQSETSFKRAMASGSPEQIAAELQGQFRQYFVTASIIKLEKLVVYASDYQLLAAASATSARKSDWSSGCADTIARAQRRHHARHLPEDRFLLAAQAAQREPPGMARPLDQQAGAGAVHQPDDVLLVAPQVGALVAGDHQMPNKETPVLSQPCRLAGLLPHAKDLAMDLLRRRDRSARETHSCFKCLPNSRGH